MIGQPLYPARYVYFIQAGNDRGPIKIGSSDNPDERLRTLQTAHYELLVLVGTMVCYTTEDEQRIHRRLASSRLRGEWFSPTPSVLKMMMQCSDYTPRRRLFVDRDLADLRRTLRINAQGRKRKKLDVKTYR